MQGPRSGDRSHAQPRTGEHGEDPPLASALRGGAPSLWGADLRPADARNFPPGTEAGIPGHHAQGFPMKRRAGFPPAPRVPGFALTKPPVFLEDNWGLSAALTLIGSLKRFCWRLKIQVIGRQADSDSGERFARALKTRVRRVSAERRLRARSAPIPSVLILVFRIVLRDSGKPATC
jgi:hypothetical protein